MFIAQKLLRFLHFCFFFAGYNAHDIEILQFEGTSGFISFEFYTQIYFQANTFISTQE